MPCPVLLNVLTTLFAIRTHIPKRAERDWLSIVYNHLFLYSPERSLLRNSMGTFMAFSIGVLSHYASLHAIAVNSPGIFSFVQAGCSSNFLKENPESIMELIISLRVYFL